MKSCKEIYCLLNFTLKAYLQFRIRIPMGRESGSKSKSVNRNKPLQPRNTSQVPVFGMLK